MEIHELRTALERNALLILGTTITCVVAAFTYTSRTESRYESHIQLYVSSPAANFGNQQAPSYARLVNSPYVTERIVHRLKMNETGRSLAARLSASSPAGTSLINITVPDKNPYRAQAIATAVGEKLIEYVPSVERGGKTGRPLVKLSISSPASYSPQRVAPNGVLNIATGLAFGLMIGLLAMIARQFLDRRVRSADDLPRGPGLELLAAVPDDDGAGSMPVTGLGAMASGRAEALRELRTNLRFLEPDQPSRTIMLTSATPGEGVSTTAAGLAFGLAEAGSHVILVEANLRDPDLAKILALSPNEGVATQLSAGTPVGELLRCVHRATVGGQLDVLVAGTRPSNPSELLSSERFPELLEDLRERCDVVLIDAPALLSTTEAAVLASAADGVIVVVALDQVTRPQLDRALGALTRTDARLLGFVTIDIAPRGRRRAPFKPEPEPSRDAPRKPGEAKAKAGPVRDAGEAAPAGQPEPDPRDGESAPDPETPNATDGETEPDPDAPDATDGETEPDPDTPDATDDDGAARHRPAARSAEHEVP